MKNFALPVLVLMAFSLTACANSEPVEVSVEVEDLGSIEIAAPELEESTVEDTSQEQESDWVEYVSKGFSFEHPEGFYVDTMADGKLGLYWDNPNLYSGASNSLHMTIDIRSEEPAELLAELLTAESHDLHSQELVSSETLEINGSAVTHATISFQGLYPGGHLEEFYIFDNPNEYVDDRGEWSAVLTNGSSMSERFNQEDFERLVNSFELL